jgi:diguanylate cyclase (GGDEF)-like protein
MSESSANVYDGLYPDQVKLVYANLLHSSAAILATVILIKLGINADWMLNLWAGYMLFLVVVRLSLYRFYKKRYDDSTIRLWKNLIVITVLLTGVGWVGLSLFFYVLTDPVYKTIVIMSLLGIIAANITIYSALLSAMLVASLPLAFTLFYVIVSWEQEGGKLLLLGVMVFTLLMIYAGIIANRNLRKKLSLQKENERLIEYLNNENSSRELMQSQLETHKRDLEYIIEERTYQLSRINEKLESEVDIRLASENELRESHARFTAVLDTIDSAVYVSDIQTYEVLFMNRAAIARWGDKVGDSCWKLMQAIPLGPCTFCTNSQLLDALGKPTGVYAWERHVVESDEWLDCRDQAIKWPDGRLVRIQIAKDITHRVKAEQQIRGEHQFLQTIIDSVADPILVVDTDYEIKLMNRAAQIIPANNVKRMNRCYQLNHDRSLPCTGNEHPCPLERVKKTLKPVTVVHNHRSGDGSERLYEIVGTPLFDEEGKLAGMVEASRDITNHMKTQMELKEKKTRLEHVAYHDSLTSLPNRALLSDRLNHALALSLRRESQIALAYLDLDGFKEINDAYGHDVGDLFLVALAKRLQEILRESDTIARLGGDEFAAVLVDLGDSTDCIPMLERMLSAASQTVRLGDLKLQVSASIGVTFYPQKEMVDADQLLRQADQAMYDAKLAGKNRYHFFETEKYLGLRGRHEGLAKIDQALKNNEFVLHYQPKVNMRSGEVIGVEALIRWDHPSRGLLQPAEFLPQIEGDDLAIAVDEWVIDHVLAQLSQWKDAGLGLAASVNISARFLQSDCFVSRLRAHLKRHLSVDAGLLELEVLETSALEDITQVSEVINTCNDMGVNFALDDFGTGYSSLTYLKLLPARFLKIDQSFVRNMLSDPEDLAILEGVLGLATAFNRAAIAEGVETIQHGQMLMRLGCDLAQGYAIAKPMPATDLPDWIDSWKPNSEWHGQKLVDREDLPLLFAGVEHRAWFKSVENYLKGYSSNRSSMDVGDCRFGRWLSGSGYRRYAEYSAYATIEDLHRRIQENTNALIDAKENEDTFDAEESLFMLKQLSDKLLQELDTLSKEKHQLQTITESSSLEN